MENTRVNIVLPNHMYASVNKLIDLGYYKSFSEAVRTGLRDEVMKYQVPMANLTESELREINEGFADLDAGRTKSAKELAKEFGYEL